MSTLTISRAQVLDPSQGLNEVSDIIIENGIITKIYPAGIAPQTNGHFDAQGALLIPGLIDLSCQISSIPSETLAAAQGGISLLCTQPNSKPIVDTPADVSSIQQASVQAGNSQLFPLGALTQGLEGDQLANMYSLMQAGCIALSNARAPIKNALVLRRIMEYAKTHDILIMLTAEDHDLSANGKMHEGPTANRLGLAGIAEVAETTALAQQILLVELTGCRVHFSQISCARSVEMIKTAQSDGLPISADVAIANLMYTDCDVNGFDSTFYVQPPLRSELDRKALLAGINDGVLAICSNHQAQDIAAKKAPFAASEPGMSTLDSWLSMMLTLVAKGELELDSMINACSILPAKILGFDTGLKEQQQANLVIVDQTADACYLAEDLASAGKNNPILGDHLKGKVQLTLSTGREVFRA
jgi:dihydroorotase